MRRHWTIGSITLAALALAGCELPVASQAPQEIAGRVVERVWPAPPAVPRIRLTQVLAGPQDLDMTPSFWARLGRTLFGGSEERFVRPTGVAARDERLYVADPGAQSLWVLDEEAGRFRRIHELGGEVLVSPVAVSMGRGGGIYLADSRLAKVFILDGAGELAGVIQDPRFGRPAGLGYDARSDRLYVADSAAHCVWIFDGGGAPIGVLGRRGAGPGEFNFPTHLSVDGAGTLHVTDALGFRVQRFASDGRLLGAIGHHGNASGDFAAPKGVAADSDGHIYVVDALFDAVQVFDRDGRLLMTFGERGVTAGEFWLPGGLFIDSRDRIYVADAHNGRVQVFEYLAAPDNG